MDLTQAFSDAVAKVDTFTKKPDNEELLRLYALYKQATLGNNNGEEPGGFDFKAIAKFRAWKELDGMDLDTAKAQYVDLVNELATK